MNEILFNYYNTENSKSTAVGNYFIDTYAMVFDDPPHKGTYTVWAVDMSFRMDPYRSWEVFRSVNKEECLQKHKEIVLEIMLTGEYIRENI